MNKKCNKIKGLDKMKNKNRNTDVSNVSLAVGKSREERRNQTTRPRATGPPKPAPRAYPGAPRMALETCKLGPQLGPKTGLKVPSRGF